MVRLAFAVLVVLVASCFAAPGERLRIRRHGYDFGHGGHSGGHGGFGGHGFGGHGFGGANFPQTQSFSQSKASASSSSVGGSVSG